MVYQAISGLSRRKSIASTIIDRFRLIHGNKYSYDRFVYHRTTTKSTVTCSEHGDFEITPANHLKTRGCPRCGRMKTGQKRHIVAKSTVIERFTKIHGNKYDYTLFEYSSAHTKSIIVCRNHGQYTMSSANHLSGKGCPTCGIQKIINDKTESIDHFIHKARIIHGDAFNYDRAEYKTCQTPLNIICPIHGSFWITPDSHYAGAGCSQCRPKSRAENDLADFIDLLVPNNRGDRSLITPLELDIVIPTKHLAIEYNGLYWHTENRGRDKNYHWKKYVMCKNQGYHLITIFEDEWLTRRPIVESILKSKIGGPARRVHARTGTVERIDHATANAFLINHHIQGDVRCSHHYGFYVDSELLTVMSLGHPSRQNSSQWELRRFAFKSDIGGSGVAERLFKRFCRDTHPDTVVSFSDNRWFGGDMYARMGFVLDGTIRPDYWYVKSDRRYHKSRFRKSCLIKNRPELIDQSEKDIMSKDGFSRIWDCGKIRWMWTR